MRALWKFAGGGFIARNQYTNGETRKGANIVRYKGADIVRYLERFDERIREHLDGDLMSELNRIEEELRLELREKTGVESVESESDMENLDDDGLFNDVPEPPNVVAVSAVPADNQDANASKETNVVVSGNINFHIPDKTLVGQWTGLREESFKSLCDHGRMGSCDILTAAFALITKLLDKAMILSPYLFKSFCEMGDVWRSAAVLVSGGLVYIPVHVGEIHFVGVSVSLGNTVSPCICIFDDLGINQANHERIAQDVLRLVNEAQTKWMSAEDRKWSLEDMQKASTWQTVNAPKQVTGSNECWLSTIVVGGILACEGLTEPESVSEQWYGQDLRDAVRDILVRIVNVQRLTKDDMIEKIPQDLMAELKRLFVERDPRRLKRSVIDIKNELAPAEDSSQKLSKLDKESKVTAPILVSRSGDACLSNHDEAHTKASANVVKERRQENQSVHACLSSVFLSSYDTLKGLTERNKEGNDAIMDSGAALISACFHEAFVLSLSMFESLQRTLECNKKLPFVEELLKSKLVVLPVHLPGHFVVACIENIASEDPQIFIYNDLHPNHGHYETVKGKMVSLVKKLRRGKGREVFLNRRAQIVRVPLQRPGSNECWLSTILNMGIVAASGEATGPFEYKQESRNALRQCLIEIAKWQRAEKEKGIMPECVAIDAIPLDLVEAFKKCILNAVTQGVDMGSGGGGNVAMVDKIQVLPVDNADELKQEPSHVPQQQDGAESEPKRAKMSVDGTDQYEADVGTKNSVVMQEQLPALDDGESELKRIKSNPLGLSHENFFVQNLFLGYSTPEKQKLE